MKLLPLILKLQKDTLEIGEDDYRETATEVKIYEESLTDDSKSKIDQLYIKLHKGPWFRVFSIFLYAFLRNEKNKIMNPQNEDYPEENLNKGKFF